MKEIGIGIVRRLIVHPVKWFFRTVGNATAGVFTVFQILNLLMYLSDPAQYNTLTWLLPLSEKMMKPSVILAIRVKQLLGLGFIESPVLKLFLYVVLAVPIAVLCFYVLLVLSTLSRLEVFIPILVIGTAAHRKHMPLLFAKLHSGIKAKDARHNTVKRGVCAGCQRPVGHYNHLELSDGTCLCRDCAARIPSPWIETAHEDWNNDIYQDFRTYVAYSDTVLLAKFHPTKKFGNFVYLDEDERLFCVQPFCSHPFRHDLVFSIDDVTNYNFVFKPDGVPQSRGMVRGGVEFSCTLRNPNCTFHTTYGGIVTRMASGNVIFPPKLRDFNTHFTKSYMDAMLIQQQSDQNRKEQEERRREEYESRETDSAPSEIQKALDLFMFDSLSEVTPEKLRQQRNRLVKAFHPDAEEGIDESYAQRINDAYRLLKKYIG